MSDDPTVVDIVEGARSGDPAAWSELVQTNAVPYAASMNLRDADRPNDSLPVEERNAILRAAVAQLSEACRRLLALLTQEPPLSYAEIGARLGVPVSGLGFRRARCLEKLRRYPPLESLIAADAGVRNGGAP